MTSEAAIAARREAAAIAVTGADRVSYLQAILSQDVEGLSVGSAAGALHLDGKGRPLAVMEVVVLEDRILLVVPDRELAEELATTLASRTFLADAAFEVLDDVVVAVRGEAPSGPEPGAAVTDDGVTAVGHEHGLDLIGPPAAVDARVAELDVEEVDPDALEAWRVAHGIPAWGREIRAPHLPEEMGLLPTHVHLETGCYPGQEAVARMWNLGRPRRRLARVIVDGPLDAGWTAGSGRSQVELTSVASHDGERVGLAYVPPDAEPGARYGDDSGDRDAEEDGAVVVRDLVGEGRPVPGHDPSVTRRRDR